ncbi:hypothetical protein GPECTOR_73g643 [Gonium pectorale]|uniref:Hint domain-containing protein n=1 Tax=Gonium pectorale TaxID=33097 RepID=A0A150G2M8_GONPE|nr:hypothetical protein GPECTOR_73g643 [Gonium pectorale]|eukprot:KXZ44122.1 hypothetical protein GPECTOR_73g643 [Gonium pectorale]
MLEPGDSVDAMPPPLVVDCAAGAGLPCTLFTVERFVSGDAAAGVVEYPAYSLDNVTSTGRRRRMYGNACNPVNIDSVEGGGRKRMSELAAGDRVLTVRSDGSTAFDDVYLFGHKRAEGMHEFLQLQTSVNASLTLSKGHFVPVARGACSAAPAVSCSVTLPASNVRPGDVIFTAADGTAAAPATVISVTTVVRPGLYNPFTLGGRIVVDGVLASAHSDWFLDPLVPAAARRFLPAVYQAVLAPVRLLYRLVPRALAQVDAAVHAGFKDGWYDVSVSQVANLAVTALASAA